MALKARLRPFGRLPQPVSLDQFLADAPVLTNSMPAAAPTATTPAVPQDQTGSAPQSPAAQTQPGQGAQPYKPSAWAILDQVLGGQTFTDAKRGLIRQHAEDDAAAAQRKMLQDAAGQIQDPHERLAFILNPTEYAKQLATRYAAANVNGGDTRVYGEPAAGGTTYTAPKVEMAGDSAVTLTPDSMTVTGQRPMSAEEQNNKAKIDEMIANNQVVNKIKQGMLGVASYRAHKAPAGASVALPPGYQARPQR